ncbi:metallophosphoesterase family protein [Streptomyces clavuligerus]|uniref:metallophosphoesterase family protein n=1 Tax=Streptomyces clavuligerus TaxID=1901 RepID=UPI0009A087DC|nr:metallophosphoesterase [Streptomyces clavuligerus]AXU16669.1 metallophosphoesterase [Streptomyces clavuligerus]QPL65207.1 metallophosphoesterase family protein [Streptomyces clavuligerus]QPL71239.1 metallophosphoesterase family protein [Streptomyces clavuligerus]QPL77321.1 metallophosphoesterase family protein [Streptomyces clavuligerus]QPL83345.1 metallophosphoesterase family protein [Streptomyces clavuligerus]
MRGRTTADTPTAAGVTRINVVSDVHGNVRDLARAKEGDDALICLGDLVLFLDYADHSRGIFPELFGVENADRIVELRTARRFAEARELGRRLWSELGLDRDTAIESAVRKQYAELFAAFPAPTYATYGNVDIPALWPEYAREGTTVLDGERAVIGGRVFGFVGGGLHSPSRTPYEISEEEYAAKVEAIGEVDVLCSHIPPDVPELVYDTVARRFERGSRALLDAIRRTRPRYALFGHVHQPLAARMRIGATECVNVGHFASTGRPWTLQW